jgi:hypothetical protein
MRTVVTASFVLLVAASAGWRDAHATERPVDRVHAVELERHARTVGGLESELLRALAQARAVDRFELYWSYDALIGAWVSVDGVQAELDRAVMSTMPAELSVRELLRTHAAFALGELARADRDLAERAAGLEGEALRVNDAVRRVLADARATLERLLATP